MHFNMQSLKRKLDSADEHIKFFAFKRHNSNSDSSTISASSSLVSSPASEDAMMIDSPLYVTPSVGFNANPNQFHHNRQAAALPAALVAAASRQQQPKQERIIRVGGLGGYML